ncbi:DUF6221 family protein [Streptomyces sp. NPDC058861]|uniref:DUF6221 family protein n=1 Tax=Streptomyces sp. NPDC058861 TaxID=3346653 RepID=UPI0036B76293
MIALHDPACVLREVETKRHMLARHVLSPATGAPELPLDNHDDCRHDSETWSWDVLLDLADSPQQEWRGLKPWSRRRCFHYRSTRQT